MGKVIKNAMILCVSSKFWDFPKCILVETCGKQDERLDDIAKKSFKEYKLSQQNKDVILLTYNYYGDVEIMNYK